jgi:hypothetical protein
LGGADDVAGGIGDSAGNLALIELGKGRREGKEEKNEPKHVARTLTTVYFSAMTIY